MDKPTKHHPETTITVEKLLEGTFEFYAENETTHSSLPLRDTPSLNEALINRGVNAHRAQEFIAELLASNESSKVLVVNGPPYPKS
jgi:hypothetical protein